MTPLLFGRFTRLDYTWRYHGKPQAGSILLGYEADRETVTAHWIDSWHMRDKVMVLTGGKPEGPALTLLGSYPAPPGPDWGWRIEITPNSGEGTFGVRMWNIYPGGAQEDLAVQASYGRG